MAFLRHQRVTSLIQEHLNAIIMREMEFGGALVTITEVIIQKDLDYADVYVSVIPDERAEEVVMKLNGSKGYLKHLMVRKINIRPMPEIRFIMDTGMSHAAKLEKTFIEIEKEMKTADEKEIARAAEEAGEIEKDAKSE